jgi:FKBP-type peptidyl-prolyl cis-trans isomerase SlyD
MVKMTIAENMVVTLQYTLSDLKTGEKIEATTVENPMVFLFGVGGIIPKFEASIEGMKVGDQFDFSIEASEAYGLSDENRIAMIPIDVFYDEKGKFDNESFQVGSIIPMSDNEGNRLQGTILEVTEETIKMDFNHPLSDIDLHFKGAITNIRTATPDEISHGHVHGPGGHHH